MEKEYLRISDVVMVYDNVYNPKIRIPVLKGISFNLNKGLFLILTGRSGSGKSTLLRLITGIEKPTAGEIVINGKSLNLLSERERNVFRLKNIGFLHQTPSILFLQNMSIADNIYFSMKMLGIRNKSEQKKKAEELIKLMDLPVSILNRRPYQVSGGQLQRAGLAAALANDPPLLIADEPTGELDLKSTGIIMKLLKNVQSNLGTTIVMVSHNRDLVQFADVTRTIDNGRISN